MSRAPSSAARARRARPFAVALLAVAVAGAACAGGPRGAATPVMPVSAPVDPAATPATRTLFANLRRLAGRQVMVGHHDDLAYGHRWRGVPGRSDVRESAGAYPSVYGWDVSRLEQGSPVNLDSVDFEAMRGWIVEGYRRGALMTVSWHMTNPVSGRNAWDTTRAVPAILPGGARHAQYVRWLDRFADYALGLRAPDGTLVPIVFRPFHEMSGSWFWWGGRHATPDEYRRLWRFTVDYLRDRRGVHHLLYCYAPDVFASKAEYLARYPGDGYVDVLGFDDYQSVRSPAGRDVLVRRLRDVVELADARGKVAAFTETGVEAVPDSLWWTGTLLPALAHDTLTRRIAWVSLWRNAPASAHHPRHFFAAYAGHPSAADFARFRRDPFVAFGDEIPNLYRAP